MSLFVQQLINGLMTGTLYVMVALGYTLIFGVLKVFNVAHPEFVMIGAFAGLVISSFLVSNFFLALLAAILVSALIGLLVERLAIRPILLKKGEELAVFVSTMGVSILFLNVAAYFTSSRALPFPELFKGKIFTLGEIQVSSLQLIIMLVSLVLMLGLNYFINKTKFGLAIRATAENMETAKCMGINVNSVSMYTMAIASGLGGAAGVLLGVLFGMVSPFIGEYFSLKALVIIIVGGLGSLEGAMIVGFLLGITEALTIGFSSSSYKDFIAFAALLIILLVKPRGLFGKKI